MSIGRLLLPISDYDAADANADVALPMRGTVTQPEQHLTMDPLKADMATGLIL